MNRYILATALALCSTTALADGQVVHYVTSHDTTDCHSLTGSYEGEVVYVDETHEPAGLSTRASAPGVWADSDEIMHGAFDEEQWEWLVTMPTGPWESGGGVCSAVMVVATMHLYCPRGC